jgi:hypothetical protein
MRPERSALGVKINLNTKLKLFIISELERKDKITSAIKVLEYKRTLYDTI